MKETIKYYYNLDVNDLEEQDGKYYFKIQNSDFFFVHYNRNLDEFADILSCINSMIERGIAVSRILPNINRSFLTKVGDYNYILLETTNMYEVYDLFDMLDISNKLILNPSSSKLYRNNWEKLWSEKVDYFEYQVRELGIKKEVIKSSLSYYIGLCENAISYVNNANLKYGNIPNTKIVLAHRRIFYPNYKLNYLNPLSFIFDLSVRDIAEYLKAMFFSEDSSFTSQDLASFLQVANLNIYELSMLYARLLFPSYYFDLYEEVMNKERDEEDLIKVIKKSSEYEEFLKKAYLEISKYAPIDKIDWLIK